MFLHPFYRFTKAPALARMWAPLPRVHPREQLQRAGSLIAAKLGLVDPYRLLTRVWSTRKHAIPLI